MTTTSTTSGEAPAAVFDPGERHRNEQLWGDRVIVSISNIVAWVFPLLIVAIVSQVVIRQAGFNQAWLDDLQWWMYGFASLVGFVYAITTDSHVRVDIFHHHYSDVRKARLELFAVGWLLLPFLALMTDVLFHYAVASWTAGEGSDSANGLHKLYLLKATLPIIFALGILASWTAVSRNLLRLGSTGSAFAKIVAMLPFIYFAIERSIHYLLWWFTRLTTDLHPRRIARDPLLQDTVWYALGVLALVLLVTFVIKRRAAGGAVIMEFLDLIGTVLDLNQFMVLMMFVVFVFLLFCGVPVAYALVGVSLIFALFGEYVLDPNRKLIGEHIEFQRTGISYIKLFANAGRFFGGIIKNPVLVALPMFIFMGLMLDQSGVAQRMMRSMQVLFGALKGGLALTVMLIGIILAASTGVIGASVVLLGVMGVPTMMAQNYGKPIATGTIAASGTLGILIPPSIMLVIMSDQLAISLGDLFMGALFPGLLLGGLYIAFIIGYGLINPSAMPLPENREPVTAKVVIDVALSVIPPMFLILLVLGSIFFGFATPTEASGLGALGATILALVSRNLSLTVFNNVMRQTLNTAGYIIGIFIAANFFAFILRRYGGDEIIENMVLGSFSDPYMVILFILFIIFLLGFLLDWIEITLIIMPLMLPVVVGLNIPVEGYGVVSNPSVVWFAILVAVTLQTSFLTPPVGFALFYLKGVCPPEISLSHIYKGVAPFVVLQLIGLGIVFMFPELATWLPAVAYGK